MVPFRGTFDHTLDAKNRLTVPARYRGIGVRIEDDIAVTATGTFWMFSSTRRAVTTTSSSSGALADAGRWDAVWALACMTPKDIVIAAASAIKLTLLRRF